MLLLEFHGSQASVSEQAETFGEIAQDTGGHSFAWTTRPEERSKLWQARHDAYWAALGLRPGAKGISTDVCVPISRLAECVAVAQEKIADMEFVAPIVGHVGDGNFHVLLLVDPVSEDERIAAETFVGWLNDLAISMDGTCTGEHGIGQGKQSYLQKELGPATTLMAQIKRAIDPHDLMNPGKIFSL